MWTCPVCNQPNSTLLCASCGFDGSCDLEHYPTLTKPSTLPKTISQLRREQALLNTLHCPNCGQDAFRFNYSNNLFVCINCRQPLPLRQVQALHKPTTPAPQSQPKKAPVIPEQGDAAAQKNLGDRFYYGEGVTQDYSKAVEYYRKAANQGDASAQNSLGNCYYCGQGVTQDYSKAMEYYRIAADQGDASAQNCLGDCYYHGRGVAKDYSKAKEYYRKAAQLGNAAAKNSLDWCDIMGIV